MLSKLKKTWNDYGFEITLGFCLLFILFFGLYRKITGKKGTWSRRDNFRNYIPIKPTYQPTRQPPRESKGETECRRVLQFLFKRSFDKHRPDFLRNPVTGGDFNLELDCFDPELKIAVEYNGVQHYQYIPFFHKNKEAFLNQKYRDDMKRRMCQENGVLLIEVPHTIKLENIKEFIENALIKNGVTF
jgi:hypothetical protein